MALRQATSSFTKTIASFASKDVSARLSSTMPRTQLNTVRSGLSSARSFNQSSTRGCQLTAFQPLRSRPFSSLTPNSKPSKSSSSSSSSSLPLPVILAPLLVTGTVALLLHSDNDTLDTPSTVITTPKPKVLTSHEMGELARQDQLDEQILKSLVEDLRKEDEHEAWVESVQAYDKLSRAIASSPRGSAEAFHYATLKEKMDDQAYENWCANCRDYERTARLDAIKNGPAADAPFHEFMLEARQQEEDARLFDGVVLEPINMNKIDLVALQAGERALAWAREREEAAVYNDAITREYDDEKFLASVLDLNGKKLVYTEEANDEDTPAQELNGLPEPLDDVYSKEMRDEAFTARWVGGAAA